MRVNIPNLKEFLNNQVKPLSNFVGSTAIEDPIIKISTNENRLVLECSSPEKSITILPNAEIKEDGEVFIIANSLSSLKSSHKTAELSATNGKLIIKSGDSKRKLLLQVNTIDDSNYISLRTLSKAEDLGRLPMEDLKKITNSLNISPMLVPGNTSKALIAISPEKTGFRAIVHDDMRVFLYNAPKSNIKFKNRLVTGFKELQSVIDVMSLTSEEADFSFTKKSILATGYKDSQKVADVKLNYSLSDKGYMDRALSIISASIKSETRIGFIIDKDFIEILENVINVTRTNKTGFIDINVKGKTLTVTGTGGSTTYNESMSIQAAGSGTVRVSSNIFEDLIRLFSDKAVLKVTDNSLLITNKWDDRVIYFVLPFLNYSK